LSFPDLKFTAAESGAGAEWPQAARIADNEG
jgi:hypothetical protein